MQQTKELLIELLKDFALNRKCKYKSFSNAELKDLFSLAKKHKTEVIFADYILNNDVEISDFAREKFSDTLSMAMGIYQKFEDTSDDFKTLFDKNEIQYIFLKGSYIKEFYPKAYLRSRTDIDVLVKKEQFEKSQQLLLKNGYKILSRTLYDISFLSKDNVRIELHYTLCYDKKFLVDSSILQDIWNNVLPIKESEYQMNSEFFVLYFLIHTAKHFYFGGCGVRSLIDLYYILNNVKYDQEKLFYLCKRAKIDVFYSQIRQLTLNIFNGEKLNFDQEKILDYIISGGAFGDEKNMLANSINQSGKKNVKTKRVFPPVKYMEIQYPILKKHKILLPFYYVKRWFRFFDKDKRKDFINSNNLIENVDEKSLQQSKEILTIVGLYENISGK